MLRCIVIQYNEDTFAIGVGCCSVEVFKVDSCMICLRYHGACWRGSKGQCGKDSNQYDYLHLREHSREKEKEGAVVC